MELMWLSVSDAIAIHAEILADSGGAAGVLDMGALESTITSTPGQKYLNRLSHQRFPCVSPSEGFCHGAVEVTNKLEDATPELVSTGKTRAFE